MMKRRMLAAALCLAMILCSGMITPVKAGPIELPMIPGNPTPTQPTEPTEPEETVPDGLEYSISNGEVTITDYKLMTAELTIPSTIEGCPVTKIGDEAFSGCYWLENITIPQSVVDIGYGAFMGCQRLSSLSVPENTVSIGGNAFALCTRLESISIPETVVSIGSGAFHDCRSLTGIWVDEDNAHYASDSWGVLFNKEQTELIQAPGAISGSYVIPNGVKVICDWAFGYCFGVESVEIPDSVISIEYNAFYYCLSLKDIEIPASVIFIDSAFGACNSLSGIWVDEDNAYYSSDSYGVLFDKEETVLERAPGALSGSYTVPRSVTYIQVSAFGRCYNLTDITFTGDMPIFGDYCFNEVTATVYYPANNPTWPENITQNYMGNITWVAYEMEIESGDVDGDGVVNNEDVAYLLWYTLFPEDYPVSADVDFNGDGIVNNEDVAYLLWHTLFPEDYPI